MVRCAAHRLGPGPGHCTFGKVRQLASLRDVGGVKVNQVEAQDGGCCAMRSGATLWPAGYMPDWRCEGVLFAGGCSDRCF